MRDRSAPVLAAPPGVGLAGTLPLDRDDPGAIVVGSDSGRGTLAHLAGKRAFDVVVAVLLLILLSPVFVLTGLAILATTGRPVYYRQRRVGRGGRAFTMLKFRSMRVGSEHEQHTLVHFNVSDGLLFKVDTDPRVTSIGRIIRRCSIDELPQLVNVLRGDMSLVGPRPLPVEPGAFGPLDGARHAVRPGITGLWQTSGRHEDGYWQMVALDLHYIQNRSIRLDIAVLLRTIPALIRRPGPS